MMRRDASGPHNGENNFAISAEAMEPGSAQNLLLKNLNPHIAAIRSSGTQDSRVETVNTVA